MNIHIDLSKSYKLENSILNKIVFVLDSYASIACACLSNIACDEHTQTKVIQ